MWLSNIKDEEREGKSTVAPVFGSNMGMVLVDQAFFEAARVGKSTAAAKKTLLLPLNIKAFVVSCCQSDLGFADCRGWRCQ